VSARAAWNVVRSKGGRIFARLGGRVRAFLVVIRVKALTSAFLKHVSRVFALIHVSWVPQHALRGSLVSD